MVGRGENYRTRMNPETMSAETGLTGTAASGKVMSEGTSPQMSQLEVKEAETRAVTSDAPADSSDGKSATKTSETRERYLQREHE